MRYAENEAGVRFYGANPRLNEVGEPETDFDVAVDTRTMTATNFWSTILVRFAPGTDPEVAARKLMQTDSALRDHLP